MSGYAKLPTNNVITKKGTSGESGILGDIRKEYGLKRRSFYPSPASPNLFMGKLQLRMRIYYRALYREANSATK